MPGVDSHRDHDQLGDNQRREADGDNVQEVRVEGDQCSIHDYCT